MRTLINKFLIGASIAAGVSAIATTPASAYTLKGSDYLLYDTCDADSTCLNQKANLDKILAGNSSSPGGNVELFASSEKLTNKQFLASNDRTSIEGKVAGKDLTISSLTAKDWFGDSLNTSYSANTFAKTWFNNFYDAAGLAGKEGAIKTTILGPLAEFFPNFNVRKAAYDQFFGIGGFQRSSDPNISYVTTSGSDLLIGLAGHYDVKKAYSSLLGPLAGLIKDGFQASEVVKVKYGSDEKLLYSFNATKSGLVNDMGPGADGKSHDGNYEVALKGVVKTPEPSVILGMVGVAGLLATKRRLKKA